MFIDTHCHLQFEQFNEDREIVIQRAIQNNIDGIITIGTDLKSSHDAIALSKKFAVIFAAIGIHPNDCSHMEFSQIKQLKNIADVTKSVAIGEIGLDYYRMASSKETQQLFFKQQLQLARELNLPVIIHNRDAHADMYNILNEQKASDIGGVVHSFSGDENFLKSILKFNFYISFTGAVTFKNTNYYKLIDLVPVQQLLLETDSPFVAPVPFRGKRNDPSYIKYIAEKIAKIKNLSISELADITSENAKNLFGISK
jgi:TatD DNase family protein